MGRTKKKPGPKRKTKAATPENTTETSRIFIKTEEENESPLNELLPTNIACEIKPENGDDFYSDVSFDDSSSDLPISADNPIRNTVSGINNDTADGIGYTASKIKSEDDDYVTSSSSEEDPLMAGEENDKEMPSANSGITSQVRTCKNEPVAKLLPLVNVMKDNRGNEVYSIDGHTFRFHAIGDNGSIHIKCGQSHRTGCPGVALISKTVNAVAVIALGGSHNHGMAKSDKKSRTDMVPREPIDSSSSDDSDSKPLLSQKIRKSKKNIKKCSTKSVQDTDTECSISGDFDMDAYSINSDSEKCDVEKCSTNSVVDGTSSTKNVLQAKRRSTRIDKNNANNSKYLDTRECSTKSVVDTRRGFKKIVKNKKNISADDDSDAEDFSMKSVKSTNVIADSPMFTVKVLKTRKGNNEFLIDGFVYLMSRRSKGTVVYVQCINFRRKKCIARGVVNCTEGSCTVLRMRGEHNHESDALGIIRREAIGLLVKKIKEQPASTTQSVYEQVLRESYCNADSELLEKIPSFKSVRRVMARVRNGCRKSMPSFERYTDQQSDLRFPPDADGSSINSDSDMEQCSTNSVNFAPQLTSKVLHSFDKKRYYIDGYVYQNGVLNKDGDIYVQCKHYRTKHCEATSVIRLVEGEITVIDRKGTHNHAADMFALNTKDLIGRMVKIYNLRPESTIFSTYVQAMKTSETTDDSALEVTPSEQSAEAAQIALAVDNSNSNSEQVPERNSQICNSNAVLETNDSEESNVMHHVKILQTMRGQDEYYVDGYLYHKTRLQYGRRYVHCAKYKFGCKGRGILKTVNDAVTVIKLNHLHSHGPDILAAIKAEAIQFILKKYKDQPESKPFSIYNGVLKESYDPAELKAVDVFPSFNSIKPLLSRTRGRYLKSVRTTSPTNSIKSIEDVDECSMVDSDMNMDYSTVGDVEQCDNEDIQDSYGYPMVYCDVNMDLCTTDSDGEQNSTNAVVEPPSKSVTRIMKRRNGKKEYYIDGYIYHYGGLKKDGVMCLQCKTYRMRRCEARALIRVIEGEIIVIKKKGTHNHAAEIFTSNRTVLIERMIEIYNLRPESTVFSIYTQAIKEMAGSTVNDAVKVKSSEQSVKDNTDTSANGSISNPNSERVPEQNLKINSNYVPDSSVGIKPEYKHLIKIMRTSKGIDEYFIDGYVYQRSTVQLNKMYVQCMKYRFGCKVRGLLNINDGVVTVVRITQSHSHEPDISRAINMEAMELMLKKCKEYPVSPSNAIYKMVMEESYDVNDTEAMKFFPAYQSISHSITRGTFKCRKLMNIPQKVKRRRFALMQPSNTALNQGPNCQNLNLDSVPNSNIDSVPNSNIDSVPNSNIDSVPNSTIDSVPNSNSDSVPNSNILPTVRVLRTIRKNDAYIIDGYVFLLSKKSITGKAYLHCRNNRKTSCYARAIAEIREGRVPLLVQKSGEHNHTADVMEIARTEALALMFKKYREHPVASASKIYNMVVNEYYDTTDPEVMKTLPTFKSIMDRLRRRGTKLRNNYFRSTPKWNQKCKPKNRDPNSIPDSDSDSLPDENDVGPEEVLQEKNTQKSNKVKDIGIIRVKEGSGIQPSVKILKTRHGNNEYFIDGYMYQLRKMSKFNTAYLHCKHFRRSNCWGRAIVKLDGDAVKVVQLSTSHSHEPDTTGAIRSEAIGKMINILRDEPDSTPATVYERVMSESFDRTNPDVTTAIPSFQSISNILRKTANRIRGTPSRRNNRRRNIEMNPNLDKEQNSVPNSKIQTDISKSVVKILKTSKGRDEYFIDGFIYQMTRLKGDSSKYLHCRSYRRYGCCARSEIKLDKGAATLVRKTGWHNHDAEISSAIRREALKMMTDKLKDQPESTPSTVYAQVMKDSFDVTDPMVKAAIPSYKSVSSILQKKAARIRRDIPGFRKLNVKKKRTKKRKRETSDSEEDDSNIEQEYDSNLEQEQVSNLEHDSNPHEDDNLELIQELDPFSIELDSNHESPTPGPRLDAIPPLDTLSEANSILEPDSIQKYIIWKVSD